MLDVTLSKVVIANTAKFSCFNDDKESDCVTCTTFLRQIGPV
jgi:hypothetical protein